MNSVGTRLTLRNLRISQCLTCRVRAKQQKSSVTTWTPLATAFNYPHSRKNTGLKSNGLFGVPELTSPAGFAAMKDETLSKGADIVKEILHAPSSPMVVGLFDKLSDTVCSVADLAEFVRLVHPEYRFRAAAEDNARGISGYVEELNTHQGLYRALKKVLFTCDQAPQMGEETKRVGELLLFDFEQSGIHLDDKKRRHFVELQEAILAIGAQFSHHASVPAQLPLAGNPLAKEIALIYPPTGESHVTIDSAFLNSNNEKLRELAYMTCLKPIDSQLETLDLLLMARHELAQLVNFPTYSHRALKGTMVQTPENAMEFLKFTAEMLRRPATKEIEILTKLKSDMTNNPDLKEIMPWDLHFYSGLAKYQSAKLSTSTVSAYFPLGACMEGLSFLFQNLFGISLELQHPAEGELWSPDVQKLGVVHETEGVLGYIYCDFFNRQDKLQQDSHFTIRGGRVLDDGSYQLPVVAIVCNFPSPGPSSPSLLSHNMVENLFHEMGHAMHSMLARTQYQHVTGTRCSTDFAEVPSVLMEFFAWDPRVLSKFACHYQTGHSLPTEMVERLCSSRNMFGALDMQRQVLYSMIDQIYHGKHPLNGSTTDILMETQDKYTAIPHISGSAWQQKFSHLNGYGAKYYSYLWSRAVASQIWHQCFAKNPFSREMGQRYRYTLLAHGGGREPTSLVEDMLGKRLTSDDMVQSLWDDLKATNPFY